MTSADGNAVLVNALSSSLRSTLNGIETVPGLIRRVLEEESWRSFTSPRGEQVEHDSFESFLTTPPSNGLGRSVPEIIRIIGSDRDVLELLADALDLPIDELLTQATVSDEVDPVTVDARRFGSYARSGSWIFGLMVARSVRPGSSASDTKVSATEFALRAGCSQERVMRYYKAWERAASDGVVPAFEALRPGQSITLPEPELWSDYFTSFERSSDRRESIALQAEAGGTSFAEALKVAERPSALRTAILGDPKTAEVARAALADRLQDDEPLQLAMAKTVAHVPELRRAITAEVRRAEQSETVRKVMRDGKARTPGGQTVEISAAAREAVAGCLAVVDSPTTSTDEVAEAYEALQVIISEAVEGDPETFSREQRSRFHKALASTIRTIESIDPEALAAVVDDDLRSSLAVAQERIGQLADAMAPRHMPRLHAV